MNLWDIELAEVTKTKIFINGFFSNLNQSFIVPILIFSEKYHGPVTEFQNIGKQNKIQ